MHTHPTYSTSHTASPFLTRYGLSVDPDSQILMHLDQLRLCSFIERRQCATHLRGKHPVVQDDRCETTRHLEQNYPQYLIGPAGVEPRKYGLPPHP